MKKQFTNKARYLGLKLTAIIFALLLITSGSVWAATESISSFTTINGTIGTNVSYASFKGGGTTDPAVNTSQIRLYQNAAGTGGGFITVSVPAGYKISEASIQSGMNTTVAYSIDGSGNTKLGSAALTISGTYTQSNLNASSVTFHCMGTTNTTRLYVKYLSVTYSEIIAPTTQASAILFSSITTSGMKIDWTNGNGSSRAVFVKETSGTITNPVDGTTYTASTNWSSKGTQLGTSGYYCVYNGTGSTVTLTNLAAGTAYYVQVFEYNGSGATSKYYTATATNNPNNQTTSAASSPTITVTGTINAFSNTVINTTSAEQSYTIEGSNLTDNISITPPTGFEISTATGVSFSATSPIVINQSGGTVNQTTIYVRFAPTSVQAYSGNITHASTGATQIDKAVSGTGIKAEPSNHATNFLVATGTPSYSTIDVVWDNSTGGTVPDGYVVKASSTSYAAITDPIDGTPETSGTLVKIVALTETATFTGLSGGTTYYFKIFPFTNSGSSINYKTDGTVPTSEATTTVAPGSSVDNPLTCSEAIANNTGNKWVKGYIVGYVTNETSVQFTGPFSSNTNIAIADLSNETNLSNILYIQLPLGTLRNNINLNTNASNLGKQVILKGDLQAYFGSHPGCKNTSDYKWVSEPTSNSTGNWNSSTVWSSGIPNSNDNVTISGDITITSAAQCNNLTIANGGKLTINDGNTLTPTGTLTIEDGGSLIDNTATQSTLTGKMKRNVVAANWSATDKSGYHLIASPNTNQSISGNWTTDNYDFYAYDEVTNMWLNQKVGANNLTNFTPGRGYLVAYETATAKEFDGVFKNVDVTVNLSKTASKGEGWNLLGNPYPSNLTWYTGWSLNNVEGVAKVWKESSKAYIDVNAGEVIPANQGFWVKANAAVTGFVIPAAARTHTTQAYNKTSQTEKLSLTVTTTANTTQAVTNIIINDIATYGYDMQFEGSNLYGGTVSPNLYSVLNDGHKLSTNAIPTPTNSTVVNLGFNAYVNGNYTITANSSITNCTAITLEDLKTNTTQNLMQNPVYNFTASTTDNANRFVLHFATSVGVNEIGKTNGGIYAYDNNIYVNNNEQIKQISVYNAMGQLIKTVNNVNGLQKINMNGHATGYYIVKVISDKNVYSEKVLIK